MHWIDPQSLPALNGTVQRFVMNRDGELDGLVLTTAAGKPTLVHFPPHMGREVEVRIAVGDPITVYGVKPRGADVIAAVSLVATNGTAILDHGPDVEHPEHEPVAAEAIRDDGEAAGQVRLAIFGPKGELRGAILDDGTALRLGKKEAGAFADLLKPGANLAARGTVIVCRHGSVLDVQAIGTAPGNLRPVKEKKPDKPKKPKKHADDDAHSEA